MANNETPGYLQNIGLISQSMAFKQLVFMIGVALSVAAGFYLYSALQDPLYRPLDYKVTDKNATAITDTLDKANIHYKINDSDGVLMVPAADAQIAKYKLAASGIQKDDSLNFSYLNDQNSIGESQFIENARYIRALEGDLVKTITAIDGISSAKVHIAIPSNNVFADEKGKPTSSVFITVGNGMIVDKEKIRSIIQIVASSVPGLDPKDVAITDQYGHYLSSSLSEQSILSAEHMSYQNSIQSYYEKRIESLINPLVGQNKVSVRVNANIDFTQLEEANEKYDPKDAVVRSEQTISESLGATSASGASGALANSPPTAPAGGDGKTQSSSSHGRNQSTKNYELSKSVTYKKSNPAKIESMSVAVILDNNSKIDPETKKVISTPVSKELMDKINELVKATIGYDKKRGDVVTVVNSEFNITKMEEVVHDSQIWQEAWFWEIIKKAGSIAFGLVVFVLLYKRSFKYLTSIDMKGGAAAISHDSGDSLNAEMHKLKQEQINQLKEIASKDPNRVALVLKNWISEK